MEEAEDFEDPLQWGESDDNEDQKQPPPSTLLVYADFECMLDAKNQFIPDLICYATSEDDTVVSHFGLDCAEKFVHDLDDLTEVEDNEKERDIHVFFHNMKGFDGTFSMDELYKQQREVVNQLTVGAKVLHFQSGTIHFKDSMCFLPFALEKFPATFHLNLKKVSFVTNSTSRLIYCMKGVPLMWNITTQTQWILKRKPPSLLGMLIKSPEMLSLISKRNCKNTVKVMFSY